MKGLTLIFVLGVTSQVPESDFYPMVEYWSAGDFRANQLCESLEGKAATAPMPAEKYGYRTSLGLKELSGALLQSYVNSVKHLSSKDMNYEVQQRRKAIVWESLVDSALKGAIASRRDGRSASIRDNFCEAFNTNLPPEAFCYSMGNYSKGMSMYVPTCVSLFVCVCMYVQPRSIPSVRM